MQLEEYRNLVEMAFKIREWNYSREDYEEKTVFSINFLENGQVHTNCKVHVFDDGICDMEAVFPFECAPDDMAELSSIIADYNFEKRYATIRLDSSDGEIMNSYSFDIMPSMSPEFILLKFLAVAGIEADIYEAIEKLCKSKKEKRGTIEISIPSEKKDEFMIDL